MYFNMRCVAHLRCGNQMSRSLPFTLSLYIFNIIVQSLHIVKSVFHLISGACNCGTDCATNCNAGTYFDSGSSTCATCPKGY